MCRSIEVGAAVPAELISADVSLLLNVNIQKSWAGGAEECICVLLELTFCSSRTQIHSSKINTSVTGTSSVTPQGMDCCGPTLSTRDWRLSARLICSQRCWMKMSRVTASSLQRQTVTGLHAERRGDSSPLRRRKASRPEGDRRFYWRGDGRADAYFLTSRHNSVLFKAERMQQ